MNKYYRALILNFANNDFFISSTSSYSCIKGQLTIALEWAPF